MDSEDKEQEKLVSEDKKKKQANRWVLYGISNQLKSELHIYAIRNEEKLGALVERILQDWLDKNVDKTKE